MDRVVVPMALAGAELVAWVCLVVGFAVIGAGVYLGLKTPTKDSSDATRKLEDARTAIDEADRQLQQASSSVVASQRGAAESSGGSAEALAATDKAREKTEDAKSAIEQVGSIVASLPENLRFAGMLVLVGAVLMGVATIQFGGTSLF